MADRIKYRKLTHYKYQLMERYVHETGWSLDAAVAAPGRWVTMSRRGRLTLKKGYAWDGPSGFMRGSLVHDACYQLLREKLLPQRKRKDADVLLWLICLDDGMSRTRADYVYHAVRVFGGGSARPPRKKKSEIIQAP